MEDPKLTVDELMLDFNSYTNAAIESQEKTILNALIQNGYLPEIKV